MLFRKSMPQTSYIQWDRIFLLKLVAIVEMTVSSIYFLLYSYLWVLQNWMAIPDNRSSVLEYKWFILSATALDFGLGSFLAYSANLTHVFYLGWSYMSVDLQAKKKRRPNLILWIFIDTIFLPINIFLLRNISWELHTSPSLSTDVHFGRMVLAHTIYAAMHIFFIATVINFLAYYVPVLRQYDPFARPNNVYQPTDPMITTTESRHIRFSDSFLPSNRTSEAEPKPSGSNQVQTSPAVSMKRGFYKISLLPLITVFWFKKLSSWLLRPGQEDSDETNMWEALTEIQLTNPNFFTVLENVWKIRKWINFRQDDMIDT